MQPQQSKLRLIKKYGGGLLKDAEIGKGYFNTSGNVAAYRELENDGYTIDYLPVYAKHYIIHQESADGEIKNDLFYRICWYDENRNYLSNSAQHVTNNNEACLIASAPDNAKYMRMSIKRWTGMKTGLYEIGLEDRLI